MRPVKDFLVVEVESEYIERIGTLYSDPDTDLTKYATTHGVVKAVPGGVSSSQAIHERNLKKISVGDTIVFQYKLFDISAGEMNKIYKSEKQFACPIRWVFCVIKDGTIIPMDQWCIGIQAWPDDVFDENIDGHPVKMVQSGLIAQIAKPLPNQATIIYDPFEELVGKRVLHKESTGWEYNIPIAGDVLMIERDLIHGNYN